MTTPTDVAARVNGNADKASLARLLVLQKAVLDVLNEADGETREQARELFRRGAAEPVFSGDDHLGRVRRDTAHSRGFVADWPAFTAWVREHVPHALVETVSKSWISSLTKSGTYIDPATGEVLEVAGVGWSEERDGNLTVETTDAAEDWARDMVLSRVRGELE